MICAPLLSRKGEVIGVIQLINKKRDPKKAPRPRGRGRAGRPLRRAQRRAALHPGLAGRDRPGERLSLQRDPAHAGGLRARQRRGHRAARSHDERPLAPRRRASPSASPAPSSAPAPAPTAMSPSRPTICASSTTPRCCTTSARSACARGARQGEEALPARARDHPRALRARDPLARGRRLSRKVRLLERGGARRARRPRPRARERRAELESSFATIVAANEPTVLKGGEFERIEALARETYVDIHGDTHPLLCPRRSRASRSRAARSRPPRSTRSAATSRTPSSSSRRSPGASSSAASPSSPARTTSASTARAIRTACAPRRSRSSRR
jgi:hypothetical protein